MIKSFNDRFKTLHRFNQQLMDICNYLYYAYLNYYMYINNLILHNLSKCVIARQEIICQHFGNIQIDTMYLCHVCNVCHDYIPN